MKKNKIDVSSGLRSQDVETRTNEHLCEHLTTLDVLQAGLSQNYCELESE